MNAYQTKVIRLTPDGSGGQKGQNAWFFIRNDGTIPYENGTTGYLAAQYSPEHPSSGTGAGMLTGTIASASEVHVDFNSSHVGSYTAAELKNTFSAVSSHILSAPTDEQIKAVVSGYDPAEQEVLWYVVKNHDGGNQGGCPNWHVDGVIINKDAEYVSLDYNKNTDATVGNMPASATTEKGNQLTVGGVPTWEGHDFLGWNTRADGQGTWYYPNGKITMTESVTLYAIWKDARPSLTITKTVTNATNVSRTFTFEIANSDRSVVKTTSVTIEGNGSKSVNVYGLTPGTYTVTETNSQSAESVTYDPADQTVTVTADATATMTVTNDYTVPQPHLLITKTGPDSVLAGDEITYQITVANNGTANATDEATVTDDLAAAELTYVSATATDSVGTVSVSNGVITWVIPADALEKNESAILTVKATVPAGYTGTSVTNTATITSEDPNTGKAEKTTAVTPLGDLVIEKTFTGLASSEAPTGFAATFSVKDANGTEKANVAFGEFTYDAVSGKYSYTVEDLPQGTGYTVTETVTSGTSIAGEVEGTKGNYVLGTVTYTYPGDGTSAAVGAEPVTVQVTNPYTWTPNTQITVSYAWTADSALWPEAAGADPMNTITGGTYAVNGFTAGNLAAVPTISVPGYTITGWSTAQDGTTMTAEQLVAAVNDVKGGHSITLYAKLSYDKPAYQVRYALYAYVDGASEATLVNTGDYTSGVETDTAPNNAFVFTNAAASVAYDGTSYDKASTDGLTNDQLQELYARDVTDDGGTWGDKNDPPKFTVKLYATTYTVGSLTITKTIYLPLSETAAWNALKDTLTFTVTAALDSDEAFTPVTVSLKDFEEDVYSYFTYTYTLENLEPGTYTVTENGADILSAYGYTWNAEDSVNSDVAVVTASGTPAVAALKNVYDSREFTVIFDATLYGNVHNRNNTLIADGSSFRYEWYVPLMVNSVNTYSADPGWQGALANGTFNNSQASQISYTFSIDDYKEFLNHNNFPIKISQPNVTADQGYTFTGSFTTTGTDTGVKFVDLETTMAALLESGQDQITYYANYTANGTQPNPDPIEPGPNPDPIEPGPSDPGTDIPDDNTPTTDLPEEETPTTELPEEETPTTELPEEEVPMAEVPATGDTAGLWALAAGVSGLALVWLALSGKKRREENA
ncbi:InlB B-repeat-containing protein [Dysosmobacter sp. Marseille-Q4140]|nr:InlB B-repeat-containing protein [Dysosmobacter sp. Marseille-Q4140]